MGEQQLKTGELKAPLSEEQVRAEEIGSLQFREPFHFIEYSDGELGLAARRLAEFCRDNPASMTLDHQRVLGHVAFEMSCRNPSKAA